MAREFARTDRVGQQIQKEVALIIQREIKDPRLAMVTVSSVDVSRDLAHAKVYVTFFENDPQKIKESVELLNEATGFIRSLLGKRLRARITPNLAFVYDETLIEGVRMSTLVDKAVAEDIEKSGNPVDTQESEEG